MSNTPCTTIAAASVACERSTGCPAELSAAQCALESGWLKHAPGNNCFGIKMARRHARTQLLATSEVLRRDQMEPGDVILEHLAGGRVRVRGKRAFAAYDSLADCMIDHARLITTAACYGRAWQQYQADRNLEALIRNIAGTYATDPQYASKLLAMIHKPELQAAIVAARQA